jgi:hypothetical protein
MRFTQLILLALSLRLGLAAETLVGLYIFSRHGDRTAKSTPPANLTDLGYQEVFTSGTWFRDQYVASGAPKKISGLNTDLVKQSQIAVSAPLDTVLQNSAAGFLQGLYPPVGSVLGQDTLRNGTVVQSPLNGFQLIPVQTLSTGAGSEDSAWLEGSSNCANALVSSNNYFYSDEYMDLLNSTKSFYESLTPMVNLTFTGSQISFTNAYTIFDLLNVASIHNKTFPSSGLLTPETLFQLRTLADNHEFNLAFNSSDPIRAVTGATLAAQIVQAINTTISTKGNMMLNIQFGAYAGFQSFFGLTELTKASPNFFGVPDYASTMVFELFTNGPVKPFPGPDDLNVRFLFHNGTTSNISTPIAYPLFGQDQETLPWNTFVSSMSKFSIGGQQQWCQACGNSTGVCASAASQTGSTSSPSASASNGSGSGGGISKAVAGVIGAVVTLAVILGVEILIMLVGGLRLVSKKRLGQSAGTPGTGVKA